MARKAYVTPAIEQLLKEKASHSSCIYRISGIAFDGKGDVLGHCTNSHAAWDVLDYGEGRAGTAKHCERLLFQRYSKLVKTIVICRIGHSGKVLPIDPCPTCQKIAAKYGAKIVSLMPGNGHQHKV